ncbi:MAG: hypothetical protein B7Y45_03065 [Sphingomonas sp. 28-66-16]|nr:MAG: hypothetical protein B7Y45_03065 [Sphingomonas sp. 28-66-16]
MKIADFLAEPDLVARRLRISWRIVPEAGETLADAPRLVLRRKTRDWEFGPIAAPDPYLVYDSAAFPGAPAPGIAVLDLPDREAADGAERIRFEGISVARTPPGIEWRRRIHATRLAADGHPVERRVEIVDGGDAPLSLDPQTAYYYELTGPDLRLRAVATPAAPFGLNRSLYDMLPAAHRMRDVTRRTATIESATIPEASIGQPGQTAIAGQLRRFIDPFGAALDGMRSSAEGLWSLRDIDGVAPSYLPLIAEWLGWRLGDADAVPLARNELKSAPRLYKALGSVTSYRAIVERYTGWTTRVAEFAQHIARSNDPPKPHLFAAIEAAGAWRSPLDVAATLGFGAGNDNAAGLGPLPAILTGTPGPYALFGGAELTVEVDRGAPLVIRFADGDFPNPANVSAAQLAARIGAATTEIDASDAGGRLRLRTRGVGADARLAIVHPDAALLTLSSAAPDAAAAAVDSAGRIHVIASDAAATPDPGAASIDPNGGLIAKSFAYGRWHGAARLPVPPEARFPAAASLPDGRVAIGWIERAGGADARICWAIASSGAPGPARLLGRQPTPVALPPGARLRLRTDSGTEDFVVNPGDYTNPAQATATEIVAAINGQLTKAKASTGADGSIVLQSVATGPQAGLAVDLAGSTAARFLGLAELPPATGSWDPATRLTPTQRLATAPHATGLTACASSGGAVRFAWSAFVDGGWRIEGAAILGDTDLFATDAGLVLRRADGGVEVIGTAQGAPSDAVRHALIDAHGQIWIATDAGVARRRPDASWATINAAAGLSSNDSRRLALAGDGALWVATASGVTRLAPGAPPQRFRMADGLPSDDVRALAIDPAGSVWAATAAGLAARAIDGSWRAFGTAQGLPSADCRGVAIDAGGTVWAATAAGLATGDAASGFDLADTPGALMTDLRAIAIDGAVWVAAGSGVWRLADGLWRGWTALDGVGAAGTVTIAENGVWATTAIGAVRIEHDRVRLVTTADGLPSNAISMAEPGRSSPMRLVDAPAARDPALAREADGRQLLAWSHADLADQASDQRRLRVRRFDPVAGSWTVPVDATMPPPGGRATDRQPALLPLAGGGARLFFTTDRSGAPGLAETLLSNALAAGAPTLLFDGDSHRTAPTPLPLPAGLGLLLLHRADASVTPGQISPLLAGATLVPDSPAVVAATMQRRCGTTTVRGSDAARNGRRKRWDDLISYTPHRPVIEGEAPIAPNEFYTRGTIGLYVSRGTRGRPLTADNALRLQQLLREFLPINMRAVLILDPVSPEEFVFADRFIEDSFSDDINFIERIGLPADSTHALLPDWVILHSNAAGDVSVDPLDLKTLRRRSFFPPPQ